jgi:hypothetical protein
MTMMMNGDGYHCAQSTFVTRWRAVSWLGRADNLLLYWSHPSPTPPQALQAAVSAVRNARAEYGVELGRRIPATLVVAEPGLRAALAAELPVLCALAKLDPAAVAVEARPPGGLPAADGRIVLVVSDGLEVALPLAGAPGLGMRGWAGHNIAEPPRQVVFGQMHASRAPCMLARVAKQ